MNRQDCRQFQEWMEAEFSGELGPKAQAELQGHLKDCVECGPVWEEYQTLRRGLRVLAESAGPSTAAERRVLRAAAAKLPSASSVPRSLFWRWLFHPAAIAFATLLLVAGLGILGKQELQRRKSLEQAPPAIAPQSTSGTGQSAPDKDSFQPPLQPPSPALAKTPPPLKNLEKQSAPVLAKPAPKLKKNESPKAPPPAQGSISAPPPADGSALGNAGLAKPSEPQPPPATAEKPLPVEEQSQRLMQAPSRAATDTKASEKKIEDRGKDKGRARAAPASESESYGEEPITESLQRELENKDSHSQTLLSTAKEKIRQKNYRGALGDLLAAQKIRDSQEIQDLILLCRSHLRGDE